MSLYASFTLTLLCRYVTWATVDHVEPGSPSFCAVERAWSSNCCNKASLLSLLSCNFCLTYSSFHFSISLSLATIPFFAQLCPCSASDHVLLGPLLGFVAEQHGICAYDEAKDGKARSDEPFECEGLASKTGGRGGGP